MLSHGLRCLGSIGVLVASVLVALSLGVEPAGAEVQEVRLARQFGVASLPAIVMLKPNVFTTTPQGFMKFADFMHRIKTLKNKPADWKELWFPEIHGLPGS